MLLRVFVFCIVPISANCFAQEVFHVKSKSSTYDVSVRVANCDEETKSSNPSICAGRGQVSIYRKGSKRPFQILKLRNVEVDTEQLAYNREIDQRPRQLYDDEYSFIFDDFNFDSREDLAICNGRNGGYGGPSYNVYLYNPNSNRFVENVSLSNLTEGGYLGLFSVESKKKQLVAHSKSGCCYHETEVYRVVQNKPVLVEKTTEKASGTDDGGYDVVTTTRKLVNGKWIKRVKKERVKGEKP